MPSCVLVDAKPVPRLIDELMIVKAAEEEKEKAQRRKAGMLGMRASPLHRSSGLLVFGVEVPRS